MSFEYPLPGRSYPRPNEIFSSWLSRIALNQGISPILLWIELFQSISFLRKGLASERVDLDRYRLPNILPVLAKATATPFEQIYETLIWDWELFVKPEYAKRHAVMVKWWLHFDEKEKYPIGPTFCASCFLKDGSQPYFRKAWRFSFNIACLDCGVLLANNCPNCHTCVNYQQLNGYEYIKSHELASTIIICSTCGYNLAQTRMYPASPEVLKLQLHLQQLSEGKYVDKSSTHLYFKWLEQIVETLKTCSHPSIRQDSPAHFVIKDERFENQNPTYFSYLNSSYFWPTDLQSRVLFQAITLLDSRLLLFDKLHFEFTRQYGNKRKYLQTPLWYLLNWLVKDYPSNWMDGWTAFGVSASDQ